MTDQNKTTIVNVLMTADSHDQLTKLLTAHMSTMLCPTYNDVIIPSNGTIREYVILGYPLSTMVSMDRIFLGLGLPLCNGCDLQLAMVIRNWNYLVCHFEP